MKKMMALTLALGVLAAPVEAVEKKQGKQLAMSERFKRKAKKLWNKSKRGLKSAGNHILRNKERYAALIAVLGSLIAAERLAHANRKRSSASLSKDTGMMGSLRRGAATVFRRSGENGFWTHRYGPRKGSRLDKLFEAVETATRLREEEVAASRARAAHSGSDDGRRGAGAGAGAGAEVTPGHAAFGGEVSGGGVARSGSEPDANQGFVFVGIRPEIQAVEDAKEVAQDAIEAVEAAKRNISWAGLSVDGTVDDAAKEKAKQEAQKAKREAEAALAAFEKAIDAAEENSNALSKAGFFNAGLAKNHLRFFQEQLARL